MRLAFLLALLLLIPMAEASHVPCPPEDCAAIQPFPDTKYVTGPVDLVALVAHVDIANGIATTSLQFELRNDEATPAEAVLNIPLPGAVIQSFNLSADGKLLVGHVKERGQAQTEYADAKATGRDAVLLQQADENGVRLDINVPAGADRTLRVSYVERVPLASGSRVYRLPLSHMGTVSGTADLHLALRSDAEISALRFPDEPMTIGGAKPHHAVADGAASQRKLADLVAVWQEGKSGWRSSLTLSAPEGHVIGMAEVCAAGGEPLARDVVYVLDRSGSMAGTKLEQARQAVAADMLTLQPSDSYNVVVFDDHTDAFRSSLTPGTASNVAKDRAKVLAVVAGSGTDIDSGLQAGLAQLATESNRMPMMVFVTDGLPSAGIQDHRQIIDRFRAANTRPSTIHVIPIGLDADQTFLADLAAESGGVFVPIGGTGVGLGPQLQRVLDVVGHTLVENVTVEVPGFVTVGAVASPVYEDGCLAVFVEGDLQPGQALEIKVSGRDDGGADVQTFAIPADALTVAPGVGGLHGRAVIDGMLADGRSGGSTVDLKAAITENATRLQQLSPYTAWIIAEEQPVEASAAVEGAVGRLASQAGGAPAQGHAVYQGSSQSSPGAGILIIGLVMLVAATQRRRIA